MYLRFYQLEMMETENEVLTEDTEGTMEPKNLIGTNHGSTLEGIAKDNGYCGRKVNDDNYDDLVQLAVEADLQNQYLKSQFEGFKNLAQDINSSHHPSNALERDNEVNDDISELRGKIESLSKDLHEERLTRGAAEEALKHLQELHSEADAQSQELSIKLAEAQQKMDEEIKDRDEKYSELDTKFNRLHKRAKQRIQEVQKEKDDIEAQFKEINEKAEQASSELSAIRQELERTRQQSSEALKAMDVERQQLRSANNKLRDNLEELRHSLAPKENTIEELQQSLSVKDQMLEDLKKLLQADKEKLQSLDTEISAKHQKKIDSLEAQIADALSDRSKASETITSLRAMVAEKESKIAEMEAASSGEAARLRAAMETIKGELAHLKNEHEKDKESWEVVTQSLKEKLKNAENNCVRFEIEVAKIRSQLESELSMQTQMLNNKDADLLAARQEVNRLENEYSSYKIRAHALLQRKDAELAAARDNEQVKALEEALKEAEGEITIVSSERDKAIQELKDTVANYIEELAKRDNALISAQEDLKDMEAKLNSAFSGFQSEKSSWEMNLQNVEETWRLRCETLQAQNEVASGENVEKELEELKLCYTKLKEEHDSFRDLADKIIEEKDVEISRILDDNKNLRQSQESKPSVDYDDNYYKDFQKLGSLSSSPSDADHQILILARQQAQREEELAQSQRHILALQDELEELEHENRLHMQQEALLKEEVRNMERMQKREGVDLTYLKNVILKLLETGEVEALLPVVAMLLQFSPDELRKCQQAYRSATEVPPSSASDTAGSGVSLFSRFSFS